jgi:PAS domain S-box-containing protein
MKSSSFAYIEGLVGEPPAHRIRLAPNRMERPRNVREQSGVASEVNAGWIEAWRTAVRISPLTVGLLELGSTKVVEVSARAAELLGTTCEEAIGLDYLAVVEPREEVAQALELLRTGGLDSMEGRRRLRRLDGSVVHVFVCWWAVRSSSGPDLGLWVAPDVLTSRPHPAAGTELLAELPARLRFLEPGVVRPAVGTLDHRWRVAQLSGDVEELLGHRPPELLGSSIIDMTHPGDTAGLLSAFARATFDVTAGVRVRMRHRHHAWQPVTAVVTVLDNDPASPFAFALAADDEPDPPAVLKRVTALEHHLQRIAVEVQAAGVLRVLGPGADATRVPALGELSGRQWEVVSRLARGERVSTIASELYISESTVRNHLSAIFRKTGVHSQRELLGLLRRDSSAV